MAAFADAAAHVPVVKPFLSFCFCTSSNVKPRVPLKLNVINFLYEKSPSSYCYNWC
jgi:hypothetical protein